MSAPPAKKSKVNSGSDNPDASQEEEECATISMVVGEGDRFSPVTRINGYPWRLRVVKMHGGMCEVFVKCEKSMESERWDCPAIVQLIWWSNAGAMDCAVMDKFQFQGVDKKYEECFLGRIKNGTRIGVNIKPLDNGNKWRCRPICGPLDGILLIEDRQFHVNKGSLASESPYFDRLFNGEFMEKNMKEITIGDVSFEEFTILMKMLYGEDGVSVVDSLLTRENVHRILELADRFVLKIVEDGVVNTLLTSLSSLSIHERLLIADQHGLTTCKERIVARYYKHHLIDVMETPEFCQFSTDTKDSLMRKMVQCLKGL